MRIIIDWSLLSLAVWVSKVGVLTLNVTIEIGVLAEWVLNSSKSSILVRHSSELFLLSERSWLHQRGHFLLTQSSTDASKASDHSGRSHHLLKFNFYYKN